MLLVLVAACGGPSVKKGAAPAPDDVCVSGLCVAKDVSAKLTAAKDAFGACTPAETADPAPAGSLKISAIELAATQETRVIVRVTLANTSPNGSMNYPGMKLHVDAGAGELVDPGDGRLAAPDFDQSTLYGVAGCNEQTFDFAIAWDRTAAVSLTATATDENGAAVADQVAFRLQL
jgi:hypothetical protein